MKSILIALLFFIALCSQNEKEQCFIYIREEMHRLQQQLNDDQLEEPEPPSKRIKVVNSLFKDLEDSFVSSKIQRYVTLILDKRF